LEASTPGGGDHGNVGNCAGVRLADDVLGNDGLSALD